MTDYQRPADDHQVSTRLASQQGAQILAGGTDLLVRVNSGTPPPAAFIDIKRLPSASVIRHDDGEWHIGAAVSAASIGAHQQLRAQWPGVVEAATLIGSTQIQSRATLGGNLCNASPAADSVPALIAAGARCLIHGPDGERMADVIDIVTAPGQTSLQPGEFVVAFRLPLAAPRSADAYLRMIPRTEMDIAIAGAGVSLNLDDSGRIAKARIALGAVAPTQVLAEAAAAVLVGTQADDGTLEKVQSEVRAICRPVSDRRGTAQYRGHVAGVLAARATRIALERAQQR